MTLEEYVVMVLENGDVCHARVEYNVPGIARELEEHSVTNVIVKGTEHILDSEMSEEDFHFCFVKPDGELDEEASPMFIKIDKLLKPMSTEFLDNIVKPLKDLMKGVSIGA